MTAFFRLTILSLLVLGCSAHAFAQSASEYQRNYEMCVESSPSAVDAAYACALTTTDASEQTIVQVFDTLQARLKMSAPDRLDALMEMQAFWMDYSKRYCRLLSDDTTVWANCQMRLQLMYLDELSRLKDSLKIIE